jgi:hypothetical protein
MNNVTNIPDVGVPFIELKTGRISPVWWQFMIALFNRTGAIGGIPPASEDGQDAAVLNQSMVSAAIPSRDLSDALIAALQVAPSNAPLLSRIASLEAAVAALVNSGAPVRRMSDLDAEINSMVTPSTGITGTVLVKG